jgi:5-methylcytosine-specific restriction endonuclease McrA
MWMKHYKDEATGKTLFELHKNQCGKGIPKHLSSHPNRKAEPSLQGILEGRVSASNFDPKKIKVRLIEQNYLEEKCYKCGFHERRVTDYKMPLFLHFKNGDHNYYHLDNLQMLCYNCYFLYVGEIFNDRDEKQIETGTKMFKTTENVNFELDEYHIRRLRELGLYEDKTDDDPYSLVSRK